MAKPSPHDRLQPSLRDRLIANDSSEAPEPYAQNLSELHESVRQDLENLLNSRRRCDGWPEQLDTLEKSLANYGIVDFASMDMVSKEGREDFRRRLEDLIQRFEPRFEWVQVELPDEPETLDRTVRFRIHGLLRVEPAQRVMYASALEPMTCSFKLERGEHD